MYFNVSMYNWCMDIPQKRKPTRKLHLFLIGFSVKTLFGIPIGVPQGSGFGLPLFEIFR